MLDFRDSNWKPIFLVLCSRVFAGICPAFSLGLCSRTSCTCPENGAREGARVKVTGISKLSSAPCYSCATGNRAGLLSSLVVDCHPFWQGKHHTIASVRRVHHVFWSRLAKTKKCLGRANPRTRVNMNSKPASCDKASAAGGTVEVCKDSPDTDVIRSTRGLVKSCPDGAAQSLCSKLASLCCSTCTPDSTARAVQTFYIGAGEDKNSFPFVAAEALVS